MPPQLPIFCTTKLGDSYRVQYTSAVDDWLHILVIYGLFDQWFASFNIGSLNI